MPLTMSPLSSEAIAMTVPSTVAGAPPAVTTAPLASVTLELRARFWAKFGACCRTAPVLDGSAYVVPSITAVDEPTETAWPAIVACAPGAMVEPAMTIPPFAAATIDWPATRTGDEAGAPCTTVPGLLGSACVVSSIITADEPTETVWPAKVACAPGAMVELPITTPPFRALTTDWLPTSKGDGACVACTTAPALAGRA